MKLNLLYAGEEKQIELEGVGVISTTKERNAIHLFKDYKKAVQKSEEKIRSSIAAYELTKHVKLFDYENKKKDIPTDILSDSLKIVPFLKKKGFQGITIKKGEEYVIFSSGDDEAVTPLYWNNLGYTLNEEPITYFRGEEVVIVKIDEYGAEDLGKKKPGYLVSDSNGKELGYLKEWGESIGYVLLKHYKIDKNIVKHINQ